MPAPNLATVFAPNLFEEDSVSVGRSLAETFGRSRRLGDVLLFLLAHRSSLFLPDRVGRLNPAATLGAAPRRHSKRTLELNLGGSLSGSGGNRAGSRHDDGDGDWDGNASSPTASAAGRRLLNGVNGNGTAPPRLVADVSPARLILPRDAPAALDPLEARALALLEEGDEQAAAEVDEDEDEDEAEAAQEEEEDSATTTNDDTDGHCNGEGVVSVEERERHANGKRPQLVVVSESRRSGTTQLGQGKVAVNHAKTPTPAADSAHQPQPHARGSLAPDARSPSPGGRLSSGRSSPRTPTPGSGRASPRVPSIAVSAEEGDEHVFTPSGGSLRHVRSHVGDAVARALFGTGLLHLLPARYAPAARAPPSLPVAGAHADSAEPEGASVGGDCTGNRRTSLSLAKPRLSASLLAPVAVASGSGRSMGTASVGVSAGGLSVAALDQHGRDSDNSNASAGVASASGNGGVSGSGASRRQRHGKREQAALDGQALLLHSSPATEPQTGESTHGENDPAPAHEQSESTASQRRNSDGTSPIWLAGQSEPPSLHNGAVEAELLTAVSAEAKTLAKVSVQPIRAE